MIHYVFLDEVHVDQTFPFFIIIIIIKSADCCFGLDSFMLMCVLSTQIVCDDLLNFIDHADLAQVLVVIQNLAELSGHDALPLASLWFY